MTLKKRPILMCDYSQGTCRSRFLGRLAESTMDVRKRAKAEGWDSWMTYPEMFKVRVDECPKHRRQVT